MEVELATRGRPKGITFEEDVIEELLERTEQGEPLTKIVEDKRMPTIRTVYAWLKDDADFAARFHDARAVGIHALAEDCLKIADEQVNKDDSVKVADKRVRIDTRLRLAGKWLPSIYGEKPAEGGTTINIHVDRPTLAIQAAALLGSVAERTKVLDDE